MPNPDAIERLRAALRPLAAIADAYDADELDENRPNWEVDILLGRGGRRLLTLADAFAARSALAAGPPDQGATADGYATSEAVAPDKRWPFVESPGQFAARLGLAYDRAHHAIAHDNFLAAVRTVLIEEPPTLASHVRSTAKAPPDAPIASPISGERDLASDRDYLSQADAHTDEGTLGETAARSILAIALHWTKDLAAVQPYIEGLGKSFEALAARAAKLEAVYAALRAAFPHFEDGAPIEPEAIEKIGREYQSMTFTSPPKAIDFVDDEGTPGKLTWVDGDSSVGVQSGWSFDGVIVPGDVVDKLREAGKELAAYAINTAPCTSIIVKYARDLRTVLARLDPRDERPIRANQTDAVTTSILGIGHAWSAFRSGAKFEDPVGWGATREAAEADLRAKEELI